MNRRWIWAIAGAAALIGGTPVHARISVDPATGRVSCESSAGHYAQRAVASRAAGDQLIGRIRLVTPSLSADGLLVVRIEPVIHCNSGAFEFELAPGMRLADPPSGRD